MPVGYKSRIFITKVADFSISEQRDIEKAMERVLANPTLNQFKRDYLTPYRQEHPTDKRLTIFFIHEEAGDKVFFVWINDPSCYHDTHKNHGEDSCIVEFKKLQNRRMLETYDPDVHEGKLEFKPRATHPHFMKFSALNISSHGNILTDDELFYCMGLVTEDGEGQDVYKLFIEHFRLFLSKLARHLKGQKQNFEFRIPLHDEDTIEIRQEKLIIRPSGKPTQTKTCFFLDSARVINNKLSEVT